MNLDEIDSPNFTMNDLKTFSAWLLYGIASIYQLVTPLPINADDNVTATFPLVGSEQGIFLPVTINDLPYTLLVDTGATLTVLDVSFKPLLGKPIKSDQAETIVGKTGVQLFKPVNIYAGELVLPNDHDFLLSNFEFLNKVAGLEFHGILGMANLYKHVWEVNFDDRLLTISSHPNGGWTSDGFMRLKITPDKSGIPTIPGEVENEKINFQIDSGDNGFGRLHTEIIDKLIAKKLVDSVATDTAVTISGIAEIRRIRIKEVKVGDNIYKNVVMRESLQNAIGYGFLKKHHVILDFPSKEFFFKKGLGVFQVDREDKSGLKLISHNNQIVVALVDERGPAAKAGILQGDVLLNVNGSPILGKDIYMLRALLKGNDGDLVNLDLARSGETMTIQFELQEGFDFVNF